MKNDLKEGLLISGFWSVIIGAGFLLSTAYSYQKSQYQRAVATVIHTTCVEQEDGFFLSPTKYTEQRFTISINNEIITMTSRYDVIIPGSRVQVYFDGYQWQFEKVLL